MIKASFSGKNIKLEWELISEKKRIEKLKNRIPRYEIDVDGDSILSSYEFPQASIRDILEAFDVVPDPKIQKLIDQYLIESTPMDKMEPEELDMSMFHLPPKEYQLKLLQVNRLKRNIILNMGIGSGKSYSSLYRCRILAGNNTFKLLVIAPKNLVVKTDQWKNEVKKCLGREALVFWAVGSKKREELLKKVKDFDIILTTYDQAGYLTGFKPDYIIIDEGHLIRKEGSKKHKATKKHVTSNPNAGKLILTGSPKPNKLENLWVLLNLIAPTIAGSKKSFLNKYQKPTRFMNIRKVLPSGIVTTFRVATAFKDINLDELYTHISPVVYTVPKSDIINFEDTLDFIDLEMTPKQKKVYYQLANELLEKKRDGTIRYEDALQYTLRLNQVAEGLFNLPDLNSLDSNHLDYIVSIIEELDEDEKLIIWSRFQPITNILYNRFKERSVLFNGTVSPARTKLGIMAFGGITSEEEYKQYEELAYRQKDWRLKPGEAQLFLGVMHEVSSIGVDSLQKGCSYQIVSAQSDLLATDHQAIGRISRLGQLSSEVRTDYLFSRNSLERTKYENKLAVYKSGVHALESKHSSTYALIKEIEGAL